MVQYGWVVQDARNMNRFLWNVVQFTIQRYCLMLCFASSSIFKMAPPSGWTALCLYWPAPPLLLQVWALVGQFCRSSLRKVPPPPPLEHLCAPCFSFRPAEAGLAPMLPATIAPPPDAPSLPQVPVVPKPADPLPPSPPPMRKTRLLWGGRPWEVRVFRYWILAPTLPIGFKWAELQGLSVPCTLNALCLACCCQLQAFGLHCTESPQTGWQSSWRRCQQQVHKTLSITGIGQCKQAAEPLIGAARSMVG